MISEHSKNSAQDRSDQINRIIKDLNNSDLEFYVGCIRRQLNTEMQSVYSVGSIQDYSLGYKQQQMVESIKSLESTYSIWLGIRGDGNCFYRSIIILYLLYLLQQQGIENLERFIVRVDNLKQIESENGVYLTDKSKIIKQIFLVYLIELRAMKMNQQVINLMKIVNRYNTLPELDFSAVVITRYLIYQTFQKDKNHPSFQMFIEEEMSKQIPRILLKYSEYAEDVIIPLAAQAFKIQLVVQNLYKKNSNGLINTDKLYYSPFNSIKEMKYPEIHVLFTQGHYEALINNQAYIDKPDFYDYLPEAIPCFLQQECLYSDIVRNLNLELLKQNKSTQGNTEIENQFENSINSSKSSNFTQISQTTDQLNKNQQETSLKTPISEVKSILSASHLATDQHKILRSPQKNTELEGVFKSQIREKQQTKINELSFMEDKNLQNEQKDGLDKTTKEQIKEQPQDEKIHEINKNKYQIENVQQDSIKQIEKENIKQQEINEEQKNGKENEKNQISLIKNANNEEIQKKYLEVKEEKKEEPQDSKNEQNQNQKCSKCNENQNQYILVFQITRKKAGIPICVFCLHSKLARFYKNDNNNSYIILEPSSMFYLDNQNSEKLEQIICEQFKFVLENRRYTISRNAISSFQNIQSSEVTQQCFQCKQKAEQNILIFESNQKNQKYVCISCLENNLKRLYTDSKYMVYGKDISYYLDEPNLRKIQQVVEKQLKYELQNGRYTILRENKTEIDQQNQQLNQLTTQQCFDCKQISEQKHILMSEAKLNMNSKFVCISCLEKNLLSFQSKLKFITYGQNTFYYLDDINSKNLKQILEQQFKYDNQNGNYVIIRQNNNQILQKNQNLNQLTAQQCYQCNLSSKNFIQCFDSYIKKNIQIICIECLEKNLDQFNLNRSQISLISRSNLYLDKQNCQTLEILIKNQFKYEENKGTYSILRNNISFKQDQEQQCFKCKEFSQEYILVLKERSCKELLNLCIPCLKNNIVEYYSILNQLICKNEPRLFVKDQQTGQKLQKFIKLNFMYENKDYRLRIQRDSTNNENLNQENQDSKAAKNINEAKNNDQIQIPLIEKYEESKNIGLDKIELQDQNFSNSKKENKISEKQPGIGASISQLNQQNTSQLRREVFEQNNQTEMSKCHVKKECIYCHQDIQSQNAELIISRLGHGYLCQQCVNDIVESCQEGEYFVFINDQLYEYSDKMKNQIQIMFDKKKQLQQQQQSKLFMSSEKKSYLSPEQENNNFLVRSNEINQSPKKDTEEKKNQNLINFQNKMSNLEIDSQKCYSDQCNNRQFSDVYLIFGENEEEITQKYCKECLIDKFLLGFEKGQTMVYFDGMIYRLDKQSKKTLESEKDNQKDILQNINQRFEYRDQNKCLLCKKNTIYSGSYFCYNCKFPQRSQSLNRSALMTEQKESKDISQNNTQSKKSSNDNEISSSQKYTFIKENQNSQDRVINKSYQSPLKYHSKTNSIDHINHQNFNLYNQYRNTNHKGTIQSKPNNTYQKYKIVNESEVFQSRNKII
ncbi:hypothetical protein ABPG72_017201 [Tetrahymena utriculariae]